jgi:hypothetical protein
MADTDQEKVKQGCVGCAAFLVLAIIIAGAMSIGGKKGGERVAMLTPDVRAAIADTLAPAAEVFTITSLEEDKSGSVVVTIDFRETPGGHDEVKLWANGVAKDVATILGGKTVVLVSAISSIPGTTDVRAYGTSSYNPVRKDIVYKPY